MPNEVKLLPCPFPPELADALLAIGEVEWGATEPKTDVGHIEALGRALDGTHAYFGTSEPTQMHGVFAKGEEIAVCHTGISPNSGKHAHLLAEAWNWLLASVQARPTIVTDEVVERVKAAINSARRVRTNPERPDNDDEYAEKLARAALAAMPAIVGGE